LRRMRAIRSRRRKRAELLTRFKTLASDPQSL
jgi:hypothetical protein